MKPLLVVLCLVIGLNVLTADQSSIKVESQIVKKVTVDGLLGKGKRYRYFFNISNANKPIGKGEIILITGEGKSISKQKFDSDKSFYTLYIDAFTAPSSMLGSEGYSKFKCVLENNHTIEGKLSDRFEDLSNM